MSHDIVTVRTCTQCGQSLPLEQFHIAKRNHQDRHRACRDCVNTDHRRRYRELHPEERRTSYGSFLSPSDWAAIEATGRMVCRICGIEQELASFPATSSHGRIRRRRDCRACLRRRQQADARSQARLRRRSLKFRLKQFNLSLEQFDRMLADQHGRCAICDQRLGDLGITVDHDHASGTVRGLVHRHCNLALGNAHEDPCVLVGCLFYLQHHRPRAIWDLLRLTFVGTNQESRPCPSASA